MSENTDLKEFIDKLYNEADILLERKEEREIKEELEKALILKIGEESINMLDQESKDLYFEFLDTKPSEEDIRQFLLDHINNFEIKLRDVIMNFASEFILKIKMSLIKGYSNSDIYKEDDSDAEDESIEDKLNNLNK